MRDFEKTEEPAGADGAKASNRLRFVIQKHAARTGKGPTRFMTGHARATPLADAIRKRKKS